ncbi:MAG: aspartyl protease family protein [Deltaproteobacteria bacterium]|nr:aspartyl protease family protein [Deltaproteobacteria bacterium]
MLIGLPLLIGLAWAAPPPRRVAPTYEGPDLVEVNMLRTGEGGNRVFVQATLPDGEPGLFMLDTGAATSALSRETAERLGLEIDRNWGTLEGLGGNSPFHRATLPTLALGDAIVHDVEVAVGVRGVPEKAGEMPLDGILGNNVLSYFVAEFDYPSDTLALHRHGTYRMPRRSAPMLFEGGHILSTLEIDTPSHRSTVFTQIDTGASGLVLSGSTGAGMEGDATEGVEAVYGIGGSEILPPSVFMQKTRRIPVQSVTLGSRKVDEVPSARWLNFGSGPAVGPQGMRGLAGHELLAEWNAVFDYEGQAFVLRKSHRRARELNGHEVLLAQDIERFGDDPARALHRARLLLWTDEEEQARPLLERYLEVFPDSAEARVLLGQVLRHNGELDASWEMLRPLGAVELVEEEEIVAAVNTLILSGRPEEGLALADLALDSLTAAELDLDGALAEVFRADEDVAHRQTWSWVHVARADALLATGRLYEANEALLTAARMVENPDAHLLRRARVALARGDRYGAIADVRRLLELYPSAGQFLWYYSLLLEDAQDRQTFRADMEDAISRLHPEHRPLDFMVAAYSAIGDSDAAHDTMVAGMARDCSMTEWQPAVDNCFAWYHGLARADLDEALARVDAALADQGERPDYLDTKAVVHLVRGEIEQAHQAALAAARMSPEDLYMLWQADRIGQLLRDQRPQ